MMKGGEKMAGSVKLVSTSVITIRKFIPSQNLFNFEAMAKWSKLTIPGLESSRGGLNDRSGSVGSIGPVVSVAGTRGSTAGISPGLVSDHLSELQRIVTSHKVLML